MDFVRRPRYITYSSNNVVTNSGNIVNLALKALAETALGNRSKILSTQQYVFSILSLALRKT
jgi:hypothetical protein